MRRWQSLATSNLLLPVVVSCVVLSGIALRVIWPADIEYKLDEQWTFEHVSALLNGANWPPVGMGTSVGFPNPGMSLWVFAALAYGSGAQSAPQLASAVQCLNVVALLALALFSCFALSRHDRERWLWAVALWAANPLAIIFERKIWPPSVLPLAAVVLMVSWWYRRYPAMSLLCGLVCALMAQIHLGVVFLAAALFAWTWLHDRTEFRVRYWISGAAFGALPAVPWLLELLARAGESSLRWRFPIPGFFLRWVTQPFGFGIDYTLGRQHFIDYLSSPTIAGRPTFAMAIVHVALIALFVVVVVRFVRTVVAKPWPGSGRVFIGDKPESVLVNAALWGYGGLLTIITVFGSGSNRHYLIVVAPIMAIWCVRMVQAGEPPSGRPWTRLILAALCVAQVAASAGLLDYIHRTQIIVGEYGPTWGSQQPGFIKPGP